MGDIILFRYAGGSARAQRPLHASGRLPGKKVDVNTESVRFASGMNISLGLWQIFSPFILGYAGSGLALWDAVIVGLAILVHAWFRILRPTKLMILSWVNLLLGAWLFVSPFLLGFASVDMAKWNDIAVGISIAFFASVGLLTATASEI